MNIVVSNIGRTVVGDVLDCKMDPLLRACRDIEPRLYFKWNPKKNNGYGTWELRIKPTHKVGIYQGKYQGNQIFTLEHKEIDIENHIKDFDILNYNIVGWLRAHDTYRVKDYAAYIDYEGDRWRDRMEEKRLEERRLMIRDERKTMKKFQEEFLSKRMNMAQLFRGVTKPE